MVSLYLDMLGKQNDFSNLIVLVWLAPVRLAAGRL
jgi:hypothetical protein